MDTLSNTPHSGDALVGKLEPIAIVGIGCRLPGDINSPSALWKLLATKRGTFGPVPESRFTHSSFYHPKGTRHGSLNMTGGHFLEGFPLSAFDASFFNIPPLEAHSIDPQQRMLLEVTWECLENAGVPPEDLKGKNVGVYVGAWTSDYEGIQKGDTEGNDHASWSSWVTGTGRAILSNRLSYVFDFKGPSMTIDTGCSASGMALHAACQALRDPVSQTHSALVGGTNLIITPDFPMAMTTMGILSPTGGCKTFDAAADGYGRGEGINCIYLKRLRDALRDGDPIRAIIRSSAVNSDGTTAGIASPSAIAQEMAIREAYAAAGITDFNTTAFIECHGTGTKAGDPIEACSVGKAFGRSRPKNDPLYIGSIKPNLGHAEGASALNSVIKAVLSLEAGKIPPNISFKTPNPKIKFDAWKLKVPTELTPWPTGKTAKRVSVSSYGYGGSNVHIILDDVESYCSAHAQHLPGLGRSGQSTKAFLFGLHAASVGGQEGGEGEAVPSRPYLIPFSAKSEAAIRSYVQRLAAMLNDIQATHHQVSLPDLAYTMAVRRSLKMPFKAYGVLSSECSNRPATGPMIASQLIKIADGMRYFPEATQERNIGFVFTGQGAQWARMGVELVSSFPLTRRTIERLGKVLKALPDAPDWNLLNELCKPAKESRINEPQFSQVLCTAMQICLVDLFSSWNVHPRATAGHSSGEIAAAYAAGSISAADAIVIAYYRGLVCSQAVGLEPKGSMLAVGLGESKALERIAQFDGRIVVACVNSPRSVTLSGDADAIESLQENLAEEEIFIRQLKVPLAYHSHHMKRIGQQYEDLLTEKAKITPRIGPCPMFSSVTGKVLDGRRLKVSYWRENLESTVEFSNAIRTMVETTDLNTLIEIGPHSALAGPIRDICASMGLTGKVAYIPTLIRGKSGSTTVLEAAGALYGFGYTNLNFEAVNGIEASSTEITLSAEAVSDSPKYQPRRVLVDLPTYVWDHSQEYWLETRKSKEWRFRQHARHDLLGSRLPGIDPCEAQWMNIISVSNAPWLKHHQVSGNIVFPGAGYICMAVEALMQYLESLGRFNANSGFLLRDVSIQNPLILNATSVVGQMAATKSSGIEVFLTLRRKQLNLVDESKWYEFNIRSLDPFQASQGVGSTKHCTGLICVEKKMYQGEPCEKPEIFSINSRRTLRGIASQEFYDTISSVGLEYGPKFAGLKNLMAKHGALEMIGETELLQVLNTTERGMTGTKEIASDVNQVEAWNGGSRDDIDCSDGLETDSEIGSDAPSSTASTSPSATSLDTTPADSEEKFSHASQRAERNVTELFFPTPAFDEIDMLQSLQDEDINHADSRYVIHPINLDHLLQLMFGSYHGGRLSKITEPLVPVFIREIYLALPSPSTVKLELHCELERAKGFTLPKRVWVAGYDAEGDVAVYMKDIHAMPMGSMRKGKTGDSRPEYLRFAWQMSYEFLNQKNYQQMIGIPENAFTASEPSLIELRTLYAFLSLVAAEVLERTEGCKPVEEHLDRFSSYVGYLISGEVQAELQSKFGGILNVNAMHSTSRQSEIEKLIPILLSGDANIKVRAEMIYLVYQNILPLFHGQINAFDLYTTNNSLSLLHATQDENQYITQFAALLSGTRPQDNILEIGAGTGATTQMMLDGLTEKPGSGHLVVKYKSYTFTDGSPDSVSCGKERFDATYPGMKFRQLDITEDPIEQGFEEGKYDVVNVVNVLHATSCIKRSLVNITRLLRSGGTLFMVERRKDSIFSVDYPFYMGTMSGFWTAEEDHRQLAPILSLDEWVSSLQDMGFKIDFMSNDYELRSGNFLLSATYTGIPEINSAPSIQMSATPSPIVILHSGLASPTVRAIADALQVEFPQIPIHCMDFHSESYEIPADTAFLLSLLELEEPLLFNISTSDYAKMHRLIVTSTIPTLWVTSGVHIEAKNPKCALVTGFARVIRNEQITSKIHLLDLSTADVNAISAHVSWVSKKLMARFPASKTPTILDWEFCEYDGLVHVPRLTLDNERRTRYQPRSESNHQKELEPYQQNKNLALGCTQRGILSTLTFEEVEEESGMLPPDHLEISPECFGLNFKDVAIAMGLIPASNLGLEVTGIVTRVGSSLKEFQPGDRVSYVGLTGFGNRIWAPATLCVKCPSGVDPKAFTASIVVYLTVLMAIEQVGRLEKGESVLIHSAAGGVGIAAIHYAKLVGAEIFVTCGNEEKRQFLTKAHGIPSERIFSSRDISFRQGIMRATNGKGVDVILNSLTGELLAESWKCLATGGRFLEIGKRDLMMSGNLDMSGFLNNQLYAGIDVGIEVLARSPRFSRLFRQFVEMYVDGSLPPIAPITEFSISEVEQAFRHMSTGTHIGKIVLTVKSDEMVKVSQRPLPIRFDPKATYLLVGGLGGIGCNLAVWMAENGAKHLTFMSRSGSAATEKEGVQETLRSLTALGCNYQVIQCDVGGDFLAIEQAILFASRERHIKGLVHAAMVLKDGVVEKMTHEDFQVPLSCKVNGLLNIQKAFSNNTQLPELDFFVVLSSISGIIGAPGQANYAAASVFEDSFVRFRQRNGQKASALDIGIIAKVGYIKQNPDTLKSISLDGLNEIMLKHLHEAFEMAIDTSLPKELDIKNDISLLDNSQIVFGVRLGDITHIQSDSSPFRDPKWGICISTAIALDDDDAMGPNDDLILVNPFKDVDNRSKDAVIEEISKCIIRKTSAMTTIPVKDILPGDPLKKYGMDSLVAVELRNWLMRALKVELVVGDILGSTSIRDMAERAYETFMKKREKERKE